MTTPQPMDQTKYKVVELGTSGWCVKILSKMIGLTKDQCKVRLEFYLEEGISPDRLRAQIDK